MAGGTANLAASSPTPLSKPAPPSPPPPRPTLKLTNLGHVFDNHSQRLFDIRELLEALLVPKEQTRERRPFLSCAPYAYLPPPPPHINTPLNYVAF
ncbi:hypothetical protein E2C01_077481 [Portunus trituberculatus]|uniref:Uncharacterized protein n=1 Tax=Portunus trituberculatus TaxID=210409 RepID=A0A5B7IPU4_PORTR|nr:hypothetical protein [Portunus trituberculatus]